uniref:Uncharacterized protein n=1 Tax=Tanacetum cinerariifolium TaxID=118510 RepID=A0A699Q1I3_TANCI|nr:hypothetical protein [Tanacetum cinerariifolium]
MAGQTLRPLDMLLYSWDIGHDVYVDLTRSSPLTQMGIVDFVLGHAVIKAAQRKCVKYETKCPDIGCGFLPFSFSSFVELEKDVITLLKRIRKFSITQDIGARADIHIFSRIDFIIARGIWDSVGKEVNIGLGGGLDKPLRPLNMLLYSWDIGHDVCVDLTGSSPLPQTGMVDLCRVMQ